MTKLLCCVLSCLMLAVLPSIQAQPPSPPPEETQVIPSAPVPPQDTAAKLELSIGTYRFTATLAHNSSAQALVELLSQGDITIDMSDYGDFEKVGPLGTRLPTNDVQITTQLGDIILYQGSNIAIYYAQNSWSFTRLGWIDDTSQLTQALGSGDVSVTLSLGS